jgi:hypothetical protein
VPGTGGPLTLESLAWISERPQTYPETVEVWQTTYPRHRRALLLQSALWSGKSQPPGDRYRSRTITAKWQIKYWSEPLK